LALARELVACRAEILLVARDPARLEAACAQLGPDAHACAGDLAAAETSTRIAVTAREHWPDGIDGALINAGGPPRGDVLALDDATWQASYELLLGGPIRLVRALLPLMRDGAALLFVTSSAVREPIDGLDTSNVLRPAVAALARTLARQLAPGIRVNSIAPGRFDTARAREGDARRGAAHGVSIDEVRARSSAAIPMGRYGDPVEFARVAAFLLSPAASYVTSTTIHVDGGLLRSAP
jgi:3-oxoacyl-[acyl-carrier protein] reductase